MVMVTILDRMKTLSAAEDFFTLLQVPFDQHVLNVSRLHILRRFQSYMASSSAEQASGEQQEQICREALIRAYSDFTVSSGIQEKLFKVFQQTDPDEPVFVPLGALARPSGSSQTTSSS